MTTSQHPLPQPAADGRPAPHRATTRVGLTARGRMLAILAALATGAAWLSGAGDARLAAALLLAPLLADLLLTPRHLHLVDIAVPPRRTMATALFREQIEVRSRGRTVREVTLHEPATSLPGGWAMLEQVSARPRSTGLQARSRRRSHLLERVFVLQSGWPFGFFVAQAVLRAPAELVTEPSRIRLPAALLRTLQQPARADQHRRTADGLDYHSLREHRLEEDARGVHALRSAALGTLVRRVTQGSLPRDVGIVLDLRRPPGRPLRLGQRRFEWSLSACATLLDQLVTLEAQVRVLVLASRTARLAIDDAAQHTAFLTFLSEADPTAHRPMDERALQALAACEQVYWIPAGGHLDPAETRHLPGVAAVVTPEDTA